MRIIVNGKVIDAEYGATLTSVCERHKPDADVLIVNSAIAARDRVLQEGDSVVLIRRGEVPPADELELLMAAYHPPPVRQKIRHACIGIAGLGGLGSTVAVALARVGVGHLVIADFDVVEPSNLNRQQYFVDQVGSFKTEAMQAILRRVNPYLTVTAHCTRVASSNVGDIFRGADVLVEAFDTPEAKVMLVEAFTGAFPDRPVVMASGVAGCGSGSLIRVRRLTPTVYVVGDLETDAASGGGLMAPRVGIAACMQAHTALRLLLGEEGD